MQKSKRGTTGSRGRQTSPINAGNSPNPKIDCKVRDARAGRASLHSKYEP